MKAIWKQKIDELNEIIRNTDIYDCNRLLVLYAKLYWLELAFNTCERD